jgi:Ion channel
MLTQFFHSPLPKIKHSLALGSMFAKHRFLLLFLFLLATLIAYPYAERSSFGYYFFRVLTGAIIGLSVYVVSLRRGVAVVTILLAIPALVQHLYIRPNASVLSLINLSLSFAFDLVIVVSIFRRVFAPIQITSDTIFGALCIYLLNGISFASIYGLVAALQPAAFFLDPTINRHTVPDRFDFIYYSFGMMTQLGAAGITAVTDQARSISVIEAVLGQLYLAVLISRLVGAYRRHLPAENS